MSGKYPITKEGYSRLEDEIRHLKKVERPAIIEAIAVARDHGDLKENAEYHSAREKQSFIEGRVLDLEDKLARAEVIDVSILSGDTVKFGATVTVIDTDTDIESVYQIVGEYEANIDKNLISVTSPLARAMIAKSEGDIIEFTTPRGAKEFEIVKIEYK